MTAEATGVVAQRGKQEENFNDCIFEHFWRERVEGRFLSARRPKQGVKLLYAIPFLLWHQFAHCADAEHTVDVPKACGRG